MDVKVWDMGEILYSALADSFESKTLRGQKDAI
jgi:hypothetical protein